MISPGLAESASRKAWEGSGVTDLRGGDRGCGRGAVGAGANQHPLYALYPMPGKATHPEWIIYSRHLLEVRNVNLVVMAEHTECLVLVSCWHKDLDPGGARFLQQVQKPSR